MVTCDTVTSGARRSKWYNGLVEQAGEALVDHLERRQPPARDVQVVYEVVVASFPGRHWGLGVNRAGIDAVDEGIHLILVEDLFTAFARHDSNPSRLTASRRW